MDRSTWLASSPMCDRALTVIGDSSRPQCARPMWWAQIAEEHGKWCCPLHGPQLTGSEAAERAGFTAYRIVLEV